MPQQRELKGKRPDLPEDAELFGLGLEDDSKLGQAKLVAGALSVVALIAMLVTSLFRAPNDEWTALLAVITGVVIITMSSQLARQRAQRRRQRSP
jgi:cytochrome c biogenesis protein CcdA